MSDWSMASQMAARWLTGPGSGLRRVVGVARLTAALAAADARRTARAASLGVEIPESVVVSLTSACNLSCPSCIGRSERGQPSSALDPRLVDDVIAQGRELGIQRFALVGGEPLLARDMVCRLVAAHRDCLFVIFTNGRLLDDTTAAALAEGANVLLLVNAGAGAAGPGRGLPAGAVRAMERIQRHGLLFGFAATVTRENRRLFADERTLDRLLDLGASGGLLIDYVGDLDGDGAGQRERFAVPAEDRRAFAAEVRAWARRRGAVLVLVPEDEDLYGGCGAAGRRMVHLSYHGTWNPCPFVPYSGFPAVEHRLLDVLRGGFFSELRRASRGWERGRDEGCCCYRTAEHEFRRVSARHGVGRHRGVCNGRQRSQCPTPAPTKVATA